MKRIYFVFLGILILFSGLGLLVYFGVKKQVIHVNFSNDVTESYYYKTYHNQNQLIVLHYWASWCEPCVEEIPFLNHLKSKYDNVHFLALSHDKDTLKAIEIKQKFQFEWEELLLKDYTYREDIKKLLEGNTFIKIGNLPTTYFIKNGQILDKQSGQLDSLKTINFIDENK